MRDKLMLTGVMVAGAALVGVSLFAVLAEALRDPASASTAEGEGVHGDPLRTASVSGLDEAARDLDLIRPPRPKQASDFTVALLGGETMKLKAQRGKPVLINFWATWCAPCREEMPAMERLYLKHRERGFVLLAVSVDSDASLVKPFLEKLKLTFPVTLDAKMDLANSYGVRALPASFLIDRNGYLAALALGPRAWDNRAAHALVEGMLAQ
jgi:peroxiredoxin